MRVGLIISQIRNGGGAYQLLYLARELKKRGHEVVIYTLLDPLPTVEKSMIAGFTIKSAHFSELVEKRNHSQLVGFFLYCWYLYKLTRALVKLITPEVLDVLNPHEWPMQWAAAIVGKKKHIPVVWMCNDIWHIPTQEEYKERRILFRLGNKFIIGFVDQLLTSFISTIAVLDKRLTKYILPTFYHKQPVFVLSGLDRKKYKTLPSKEEARKALGIENTKFIFLCFSIFLPHRRFEDAVLAFKQLQKETKNKESQLYIVGSDAYAKWYADSIKDLVVKEGLAKSVSIKNTYLSSKQLINYLVASDVFVFPNEKQTWGLIVTEAMACARLCIVSNDSGVAQIIQEGETGFIYTGKDVKQLFEKMLYSLENKSETQKIGAKAREYVLNNLSWGKYAMQMEELFMEAQKK